MSESFFHLIPFIFGLVFGVVLVYFFKDQKITIIDYPKPYDTKVFIDKNNIKYTYTTSEVNCDSNEATLKHYPLQ